MEVLFPEYLRIISRIYPYHGKQLHTSMEFEKTMEIWFSNLFLQYFQTIAILWKRCSVSSDTEVEVFGAILVSLIYLLVIMPLIGPGIILFYLFIETRQVLSYLLSGGNCKTKKNFKQTNCELQVTVT